MKHYFIMLSVLIAMLMSGCDKNKDKEIIGKVSIEESSIELKTGETISLKYNVEPKESVKDVEWISENSNIAEVNNEGFVTAKNNGETVITAKLGNSTDVCIVKVVSIPVESVSLDKKTLELVKGEKGVLKATIMPENADNKSITWSSSNESIATVDENGVVNALSIGNCEITATAGACSDICNVSVSGIPVESVTLNPEKLELVAGNTGMLTLQILPQDADYDKIEWNSSDESIAYADEDGTVHAVNKGNATISVTVAGKTAEAQITVVDDSVPEDLEIGDFYYADGTFSKEYNAQKELVGIVFWLGDPTQDDPTLKKEHPNCTHGLAISISGDYGTPWQEFYKRYAQDKTLSEWIEANTEYIPIITDKTGEEPDYLNKTMGYNNTQALKAFNAAQENEGWPVNAITYIEEVNQSLPAPKKSSGWYLPSAKELHLAAYGETDNNIGNYITGTEIRDLVNLRISESTGTYLSQGSAYLSSSESNIDEVFVVDFYNGGASRADKDFKLSSRVRYILAF